MADQRRGGVARRWRAAALVAAAVAALCALGVLFYADERGTRQADYVSGDTTAADGVELDVTLQRIDPAARQLAVVVLATLRGALADRGDELVPGRELVVETSSLTEGTLRYPAGQRVSAQNVTVSLDTGVLSDYPFDRYTTRLGFYAEVAGQPVPVSLRFRNYDPSFLVRPTGAATAAGGVSADLRFSRSRGTFLLAWFLMATMWVLALSVLGAAVVIVRQRRGLVWPALGWMAATLFALVAVRNAVPGTPPIGSLFDYAAFLWAEAVIAIAVGVVAAVGVVVEHRRPT